MSAQEHPGLTKADKKQLCRILDCQKLSPEIRPHIVRNESLPLRTIVQVLFFDREKGYRGKDQKLPTEEQSHGKQQLPQLNTNDVSILRSHSSKQSTKAKGARSHELGTDEGENKKLSRSDGRLRMEPRSDTPRHEGTVGESRKGKEAREGVGERKLENIQILPGRTGSHHRKGKSREREPKNTL